MNRAVRLVEVSPRDGLQNEPEILDVDAKLRLIESAIDAGLRHIEAVSFVNPKKVPQMADAEAVCERLPALDDVEYAGLVLNRRGLERAAATGRLDHICMVVSASDEFGVRNQGMSVDESVDAGCEVLEAARAAGLGAQVIVTVCFGCPFEGEVDAARVVEIAARLAQAQPSEIALADTIGVGVPSQVRGLFQGVRSAVGGDIPLRAHFHNTRGTGIANALAAMEAGVEILDASLGGIGGCPFAPGAAGNIATEDLLYMLDRMGIQTGAHLDGVIRAADDLSRALGRPVPSMVSRAGGFPRPEGP